MKMFFIDNYIFFLTYCEHDERMDAFNSINKAIEWIFMGHLFSNDCGCSCEICNLEKMG